MRGLALPSRPRPAPEPGPMGVRNVGRVGSALPGGESTWPSAAHGSGEPLAGLLGTFVSRETWLAHAHLVVSLAVGGLFALATVVALLGSLVTAWILGVGVLVRAGALRLTARMARF